jgi:hypothetical protein
MSPYTKTPLTKIMLGENTLTNQVHNSYDNTFGLPTQVLGLKAATLASYLPMSDEARGVLAAIAERLAIMQPIKPVPYMGEVYRVSWVVERDCWGRYIPDEAIDLLLKQTPDKPLSFWRSYLRQVGEVINIQEACKAYKGDVCRLEIKADFSDWRIFMTEGKETFKHIYSNGHVWRFSGRRVGDATEGKQIQFHFWQTHENVGSFVINEQDQTIEYRFRPLDILLKEKPAHDAEYQEAFKNSLEGHYCQILPLKLMDAVQVPEKKEEPK